MNPETFICPRCATELKQVKASLRRSVVNSILCGPGSSQLHVSETGKPWWPFLKPNRVARALYCKKCGCLTIEPTIPAHRKELGLDS